MKGFKIIPINPFVYEILGEKCNGSLLEMPEELQCELEVVDIFRPPQDVPPIVEQAVKLKRKLGRPYVIWMQLDIMNEEAARMAREAGMQVVMNACMMIQRQKRGM